MDMNYDVITLFQNTVILRRSGVAIFADIIKMLTTFIKKIIKDSRKVKRIRNYLPIESISVFIDITKFADFREKLLMSAELRGCIT